MPPKIDMPFPSIHPSTHPPTHHNNQDKQQQQQQGEGGKKAIANQPLPRSRHARPDH